MSSAALLSSAVPSSSVSLPVSVDPQLNVSSFERASSALAAYQRNVADGAVWSELKLALHAAAAEAVSLSRQSVDTPAVEHVLKLVREIAQSGVHLKLAAEGVAAPVGTKGWPTSLAQMMLLPTWACAETPPLDKVPEWLWEDYAAWLFAVPEFFSAPGQVDRFTQHWETRVNELAGWIKSNPAARVVKVALDCYLRQTPEIALRASRLDLRGIAESHARIIARLERKAERDQPPILIAREGRRMRVGFIIPEFDGSAEMQAALPLICRLDPERFEVEVFVQHLTQSTWEQHARTVVSQMQELPVDVALQTTVISHACLDVLVFAGDVAQSRGDLGKLAAHRLAALQVATSGQNATTTGAASIDLFVSGEAGGMADAAHQLTERLGLLVGPIRSFDQLTGAVQPTTQWTRDDLGIPADAVVFVASATWCEIRPEEQMLWADVLSQLPGSRLVIQPAADSNEAGAGRLAVEFDRLLAVRGVTEDRCLILQSPLPSQGDVESLFGIGDVFLDLAPSINEMAALSALKAGLPVVTMAGSAWRSRRVAALLESMHLGDLVAADFAAYTALALRLGQNQTVRAAFAERVRAALVAPVVFDALAVGDGFGDLIETAFDEVLAGGLEKFRANRVPLRVSGDGLTAEDHISAGSDALILGDYFIAAAEARLALRIKPALASARALIGRALLGLDQPSRAVDYLLSAADAPDADASRWFDLARALQLNQQFSQAVQSLEVSLRLDPQRVEAWLMLIEIAEVSGLTDMARDAVDLLASIAPEHPSLSELRERYGRAVEQTPL